MTIAAEFLEGSANPDGLSVDWIVAADNETLERRHDWIQWAFALPMPSRFNPHAPLLSPSEARLLTPSARKNLGRLYTRFMGFLAQTEHWRRPNDHNHLRITRALACLRAAGLHTEAEHMFNYVRRYGNPTAESREFWYEAVGADRHLGHF
jgi:hypothetical protein